MLFGAVSTPAPLAARAIGSYAKGCLSGGVSLPINGPDWQVMRLSRNRNWGHPRLLDYLERLASDARGLDGWPGLLVGDMAQPRGGPMITGHTSHQIGLDADIWLTPMPDRVLTPQEREDITATSMLKDPFTVDPNIWTPLHTKLIKRAASYPQVARIFVHPAIKKVLCEQAGKNRAWLSKVRPWWNHYYHFHVRLTCPPGRGGLRQPEAGGERGRLRQGTRGVVQDAAQGRAMAVSATKPPTPQARCQASAEEASDGPQRSPDRMHGCAEVRRRRAGGCRRRHRAGSVEGRGGQGRRAANTEARSCGLRGAQGRVREEGEVEARGES